MIEIWSGGQSGVDQAGLRAAHACQFPTAGYAPHGWLAEVAEPQPDGSTRWVERPCPWLADYGLVECRTPGYPARTVANVKATEGTLWLGDWHSRGGRLTLDSCRTHSKPFLLIHQGITKPSNVRAWIEAKGIRRLLVAGNRESKAKGIGARAEAFLIRVFNGLPV